MAKQGKTKRKHPRKDPLQEKAENLEEIREFVDETSFGGDEREAIDELSVVDQQNDNANMTFQRELDQTIRRIVDIEEEQIRHAMERRREGAYGFCERCGRPIPPERLKARPEATTCIECQQELERHWGE